MKHNILRAVIDTNHIMSVILSSRGASAKLIDWMTREEDYFRMLLSPPIWEKYTTVADWLIPPSKQSEKEVCGGSFINYCFYNEHSERIYMHDKICALLSPAR